MTQNTKFKVGDWVCEQHYDHEWDDIYQVKDIAWDGMTGECLISLEEHRSNGASNFNATKDYYWSQDSLEAAPDYAIKEHLAERTTQEILTRLANLDILALVPEDLTPDQCSVMMPGINEVARLSGLAAGLLRGKCDD